MFCSVSSRERWDDNSLTTPRQVSDGKCNYHAMYILGKGERVETQGEQEKRGKEGGGGEREREGRREEGRERESERRLAGVGLVGLCPTSGTLTGIAHDVF